MQVKFPQLLRQERELRGWSQARAAEELGTTPNTISAWERGISVPSPYFREKLCRLLAKNAQELGLLPANDDPIITPDSEPEKYNATAEQHNPASPTADTFSTSDNAHPTHPFRATASFSLFAILNHKHSIPVLSGLLAILIIIAATLAWPLIVSPNPYAFGKGQLVINDPLKGQGQHLNWQEGWNENGAACQFKRDAYYSIQPLEGYFHACIAQGSAFHNFAYEVDATIYHGDYVGIIFRATSSLDSKYYLFRVYNNGTYMLKRYVDRVDAHAIPLDSGTVQQWHKGSGQTNKLAVLAEDQHLVLYVNQQMVTSLIDPTYSNGQIGVLAGNEQHPPAEAAFRNVKVWAW